MYFYEKRELKSLQDFCRDTSDSISSMGEEVSSILSDADREAERLEEEMKELVVKIETILKQKSDIFSEKLISRINSKLDYSDVMSILDDFSYSFEERDVMDNFNSIDDYLNNFNFSEIKDEFEESASNKLIELERVYDFLSNLKVKKHHFIIDRRAGIISIRDRKHPSYQQNKKGEISIENPDVYLIREGKFNGTYWFIEESLIEDVKKICKKLNTLWF